MCIISYENRSFFNFLCQNYFMALTKCRVQFYQKGVLKSFKVTNRRDAISALRRFNVPSGWYVERRKQDGSLISSVRIYSNSF